MADAVTDAAGRLSVIVPCAGAGRRFGAPYPKELHRLSLTESLLDRALAPVRAFAESGAALIRLIVVINPDRVETVRYVAACYDRFELAFVVQPPDRPELAGAVAAALPFCTGPACLVLPDQIIADPRAHERFTEAVALLGTHPGAALAEWVDDPNRLSTDGALRLADRGGVHYVTSSADKPADPSPYNAAWAVLFAAAHRYRLLVDAVGPATDTLVGVAAVLVEGFQNVNDPVALT